jgi:phosphatidate cytidylyltransferase
MQNLIFRSLSGIVLIGIFLLPMLFNQIGYDILFLIAFGMFFEWNKMTKGKHIIIGTTIVLVPILILGIIHYYESWKVVFAYFCLLWSVDIFAMIGGKVFQGPKLAPNISPNKTWSGLICGALSCSVMLHLIMYNFSVYGPKPADSFYLINFFSVNLIELIIGIIFASLAQIGDLFVSIYKRKFFVKNTGNFIPGHGGILDRFDGIILTSPFALFLINFTCWVS